MSKIKRPYLSLSQNFEDDEFKRIFTRPDTSPEKSEGYKKSTRYSLHKPKNNSMHEQSVRRTKTLEGTSRTSDVPSFVHEYLYISEEPKPEAKTVLDTYNSWYHDRQKSLKSSTRFSTQDRSNKNKEPIGIEPIYYDNYKAKHKLRPKSASKVTKIRDQSLFQTYRIYKPKVLEISPRSKFTIYLKSSIVESSEKKKAESLSLSPKKTAASSSIQATPNLEFKRPPSPPKFTSKVLEKTAETYGEKLWKLNELSLMDWIAE
ncbi:unnamed protein product [Blepharisma stoltei]|uniref:Uncharacterized protein n=1 Tax=Blepharisma stoltei TaxID=1481888 RepID=A0AAU9KHA9_9CILI|nr:unnamed protein product [Blepharisma stoltei]